MEDKEIIKALEHCINDATCEQCNYSPSSCFINENALDLIKRQKAEIERLTSSSTARKPRRLENSFHETISN